MKRLDHIRFTRLIIIAIILITVAAHIAQAQGTTPAPVSDLTNKVISDIELFLGTYAGVVGIAAAFIVGLLKKVSALDGVDARLLTLATNAVLVIGLLLFTNFGFGTEYKAVIEVLPKVGQIVLGLLAAFAGSTSVHEAAYAYGVPVFGLKRGVAALAVKPDHSR